MSRLSVLACAALLVWPGLAIAAPQDRLDLPIWSAAPFALLLLTIALLPLAASHWWHNDVHRAFVAAGFALPVAAYLGYMHIATGQATLEPLWHELKNYLAFIALLGSLYTVAGGIVIGGDLQARPRTNTAILAIGAVLANFIGTTGASVLLIRPMLRMNKDRRFTYHLPIFFIFLVGNLGGLLTPLGDPPLFLGFLNGVPFFWTLSLWPQWLLANGMVLAIFLVWDTLAFRRESVPTQSVAARQGPPLTLQGWLNLPLLAGIIGGVLLQAALPPAEDWLGIAVLLGMAALSLWLTPRELRKANSFTWGPIREVAILFLAIFVTMVPALEIMSQRGADLGLTQPWHFFWLTGLLSGFLDNAPTYLTFATLAAGSADLSRLLESSINGLPGTLVLAAISCGAVFMGALTYIGNGPNFMVKAIAEEAGFKTPSFIGYLAFSCAVLVPVFVVITLVFF